MCFLAVLDVVDDTFIYFTEDLRWFLSFCNQQLLDCFLTHLDPKIWVRWLQYLLNKAFVGLLSFFLILMPTEKSATHKKHSLVMLFQYCSVQDGCNAVIYRELARIFAVHGWRVVDEHTSDFLIFLLGLSIFLYKFFICNKFCLWFIVFSSFSGICFLSDFSLITVS